MIKKIGYKIFFIFLIYILHLNFVNASGTCEYKSKINQCWGAQNGKTKSIEDFVCITGNIEEVTYQIVLDQEFKKIDKKMDKYLEKLETNKNTYFGEGSSKTYVDGINNIHDTGNSFKSDFYKLCSDVIIEKVLNCSEKNKTTVIEGLKYFLYNGSSCKRLVDKKISIFKDVAFSTLMLNKLQTNKDSKKLYDQGERTNYNHLLDIMMINLGYIERIWQKWPSKLAHPMQ